jgi:hypothetical protein
VKILRITGSGFVKTGAITDGHPVAFRHWQEVVDECDRELEFAASSDEEEAVVELWLEDPMSFQTEEDAPVQGLLRRGMINRADNFVRGKQAARSETNWDREFADAQLHAASVLSKLGNGR